MSILRLIPDPPGRISAGEVVFDGQNLLTLDDEEIRAIRGNRIAMIFQEPMSSLNPSLTIGLQIAEPINLHRKTPWARRHGHGGRAAGARAHVRRREPDKGLSAPVLRRHAPARHDRHGARLPAAADHRRRADDGARRHRAGADPGAAQGGDARGQLGADPDHPRSRRGGALRRPRLRHVRRPHRRGRDRRARSTRGRAIPTRSA